LTKGGKSRSHPRKKKSPGGGEGEGFGEGGTGIKFLETVALSRGLMRRKREKVQQEKMGRNRLTVRGGGREGSLKKEGKKN